MGHVLVLDATYEPLCVVPDRRAVALLLTSKAVAIADTDRQVRSASRALPLPAVVRLTRHVRLPHRGGVPLTRRAVFARDGGRCVYCGAAAASIDHVVPKSRGGQHVWDNVVSACHRCNRVKGDRHLHEIGWRLRHAPSQPIGAAWRIISSGRQDPSWDPYLAGWGSTLGAA